jgi:ABC-type transporter Mla maintaining outer membrane lipid asymmetry ATPase subunit MlaF
MTMGENGVVKDRAPGACTSRSAPSGARRLDLDVRQGESLVVIGGSGTGKSVLLKHIIGLLRPDAGRIEVDGVDLASLATARSPHFRRRFGMAFQEGALFDSMTVAENVGFPLAPDRPLRAAIRRAGRGVPGLVRLRAPEASCRPSSPAACGGGSGSPAPSPTSPRSCCSTSPPPASTR